jgi:hypothetical protein
MQPARKPDRQEETGDAILTTIYSELLAAAGTEFLPQAEGEPDAHYIRRLVLIVCSCTDEKWETLSKTAQDWNNAQALRLKAQQDPEECPGFNPQLIVIDEASSIPKIVDAVVDAGWPKDATAQADAALGTVPLGDQDSPHALSPKHTATDAVRALVMLHQDWNQSQIAAELEAHGQPVSLGTIATVRSMTLATITVAKRLGKWVEG